MFAPEKRNTFPSSISVAPDLVTKPCWPTPAVGAATAITHTHTRTQASAAIPANTDLPHSLGSHHVICRQRRPVAAPLTLLFGAVLAGFDPRPCRRPSVAQRLQEARSGSSTPRAPRASPTTHSDMQASAVI